MLSVITLRDPLTARAVLDTLEVEHHAAVNHYVWYFFNGKKKTNHDASSASEHKQEQQQQGQCKEREMNIYQSKTKSA